MQDILSWIKEFLVIYLVLTILTHLAASDQYKKYLRFFSGIVLLLTLVTPVLRIFGEDGWLEAMVSNEAFLEELDSVRKDAQKLEFIQNSHFIQKYEQAVAQDIQNQAKAQGLPAGQVQVSLTDNYEISHILIQIDTSKGHDFNNAAKQFSDFLKQTYGLKEHQVTFRESSYTQ